MCRVWCKQSQSPISSPRWVIGGSSKHVKTHDSSGLFFFQLSPLSPNHFLTSTVSPNSGCCDWRISELWPVVSKLSEGSLEILQTQARNLQTLASSQFLPTQPEFGETGLEFEDFQIRVRVAKPRPVSPNSDPLGPAFTL